MKASLPQNRCKQVAISALTFIKSQEDDTRSQIVCEKSRLAPKKNEQTIPCLLVLSFAILVAVKLAVSIDKAVNGKIAGANLVIYGEMHCIG